MPTSMHEMGWVGGKEAETDLNKWDIHTAPTTVSNKIAAAVSVCVVGGCRWMASVRNTGFTNGHATNRHGPLMHTASQLKAR
jgi:hypothetical protein